MWKVAMGEADACAAELPELWARAGGTNASSRSEDMAARPANGPNARTSHNTAKSVAVKVDVHRLVLGRQDGAGPSARDHTFGKCKLILGHRITLTIPQQDSALMSLDRCETDNKRYRCMSAVRHQLYATSRSAARLPSRMRFHNSGTSVDGRALGRRCTVCRKLMRHQPKCCDNMRVESHHVHSG